MISSFTENLVAPYRTNAGTVIWSVLNAILGAYVSFIIFARLDARGKHNAKRVLTIAIASVLFSLGCWSSQLLGTRITLHFGNDVSIFLPLDSGFVVLSFLLPCMIIFGAFIIMDVGSTSNLWICGLCASVIGLSVDFMHYALYLSFPTIFASFTVPQILISLLLCISAPLFSFLCLIILRNRFLCCPRMRVLLPLIFGSAIAGANFVSLNGTNFFPKSNFSAQTNADRRNSVTMVLPAIITFTLTSSIIILQSCKTAFDLRKCTVAPRLTIASIAFSTDGRVLVNEKGMLPVRIVDLQGLPKDILEEFDTEHDVFHWLMSVSFNWDVLMPFMGNLEHRSIFDRRLSRRILPSFVRHMCNQMYPEHTQSSLKLRLLTAIAQLANDLDISITELGYLYDRTLETGTHIDLTEFLLLSENASTEYHDVQQKALKRTAAAETSSGLMMFFVRELPQRGHSGSNSSSTASNNGSMDGAWPQKYAEKGYRLKFMRRFRDTLADATGAAQRDVDRILLGCRDYVSNGTKSVLEPGGTYISLYSERSSASGTGEVLVYDFAKHQIPSYRLDIEHFSAEARVWLQNAAGITATELMRKCREDVVRVQEEARFSGIKQHADYLREKGLVGFKEALAFALENLLQEMSFLDPELAHSTRLTNEMCAVPSSSGGEPATTIILDVELPDGAGEGRQRGSSISSSSSGTCAPAMPSLFTYSPKPLFDVSQALARTSMDVFRESAAAELEHLLAAAQCTTTRRRHAFYHPNAKSRLPHSNSGALVSSFSLDTISLAPSTKSTRSRRIASKLASCWTAVREGTRSLPVRLSPNRSCGSVRPSAPSSLARASVASISVVPGSRSLIDIRRHRTSGDPTLPPVPPLPTSLIADDGKLRKGTSSRHPYLHLNLPSPLVLANHHGDRRGSDATMFSSDAEPC